MVRISGQIATNDITGSVNDIQTLYDYIDRQDLLKLDKTGGEISGDLVINGNVTLADTVYDDMQFPVTQAKKGINDKPDFDLTNIGLLFPQNDETEYIVLAEQFSHSLKLGTPIEPHIHYIQDEAAVPVFVLQYRWYNNGDQVPAFTTIESTGAVLPYTSGTILQMVEFPLIDGSHITGVSSWFEAKLYRKTGDAVTGDVLVKSFDIHYQKDSLGSDTEYTN